MPESDADMLMARGVVTVAHEAQHSTGIADEGEAQCRAVRLAPDLLEKHLDGLALADAVDDVARIHALDEPLYKTVC
jgi:hypothetical protein